VQGQELTPRLHYIHGASTCNLMMPGWSSRLEGVRSLFRFNRARRLFAVKRLRPTSRWTAIGQPAARLSRRVISGVMSENSVVVTELRKEKGIAIYLVDHTMLVIYPAGPVAGERVL
jgi:hypothetical protein